MKMNLKYKYKKQEQWAENQKDYGIKLKFIKQSHEYERVK